MALGWPEQVPGLVMMAIGRCRAAHESFELTFSSVLGPSDALSLRFPMFWGPRTLSPYACAAKLSGGEFWMTVPDGKWGGFWAQGGNL